MRGRRSEHREERFFCELPEVNDPVLDQRFAWRWLLPLHGCSTLCIQGFAPDEQEFLASALRPIEVVTDDDADLWLIDGDASAKIADRFSSRDSPQVVAVVAHRSRARRWGACLRSVFPTACEYALVPAPNPRLVVPLTSSRHVLSALRLYRPGRRLARAAIWVAGAAARLHIYFFLRGHVLLVASRGTETAPTGAISAQMALHAGPQIRAYALYLGTTLGNRKTVVLPLPDHDPNTIAKIGATGGAADAIRNEVLVLQELDQWRLASSIPRVQALVSSDDSLAVFEEYRERLRAPKGRLRTDVARFLARLSTLNRDTRPLASLLGEKRNLGASTVSDQADSACAPLLERIESLAKTNVEFYVHQNHGDFTPWNVFWTRQGLFVFDWEESRRHGVALDDAFTYVVIPAILVGRHFRPKETVSQAIKLGIQVAQQAGLNDLDVYAYLALWLVDRVTRVRRSRIEMRGRYAQLMAALGEQWQRPTV
jgi:hypothetical protein